MKICVVGAGTIGGYVAARTKYRLLPAAPGVIRHVEGNRFPIGELDGEETDRARAVTSAFTEAGFKVRILDDIRSEIWLKL